MQQPRRTSEFHMESGVGTAIKSRQSRQTQRHTTTTATAPSPVPVISTRNYTSTQRPSRIAVPTTRASSTRVSSSDRFSAGQSLGQPPNSCSRAGGGGLRGISPQPQRTPLPGTNVHPRSLFTAEKQGGGGGGHNDKKWVQEQTQRISEYLGGGVTIPGIGSDFFQRGAGLRQMSIKHFIAIINYFLSFATRFTVKSATYVDDIVSILQKLRYPHPINKSWLKTPNTQHSFGNVIVLLDFLMDFVPEASEMFAFPLKEVTAAEVAASRVENQLQIPDTEFQAEMLRFAESGFKLWDKNLMDEFEQLKQHTCDMLIYKCSGVAGLSALEAEVAQLRAKLDELKRQRPSIPKDTEEKCRQQEKELKYSAQQLEMQQDDFECNATQLQQLQAKRQASAEEIARLEAEMAQLQANVNAQMSSVEQRNALIDEAAQLAHVVDSQKRTIHVLQQRNYQQQVLESRVKKQLTDQVEKFNVHMHDIVYSGLYADSNDLQLPVQPSFEDLQRVHANLKSLNEQMQTKLQKITCELLNYERKITEIEHEIDSTNKPQSKSLGATLTAAQNRLQDAEKSMKQERHAHDTLLQQLEEQAQQLQAQTVKFEQMIEEKQQEVERMKQENELTMSNGEQEYYKYADAREAYLDKFEAELAEADKTLQQVTALSERNEIAIAQLKQKCLKK